MSKVGRQLLVMAYAIFLVWLDRLVQADHAPLWFDAILVGIVGLIFIAIGDKPVKR